MIEGKFKGRNIVEKPTCPFCTAPLERPSEGPLSIMPVGSCACGAVYVCDVTGHNLGSALVDALLLACDGDSDRAWNLMPQDDYLDRQLKNYDLETHQIIHGGVYQGRRIAGALLFVRLERSRAAGCPISPNRDGEPPPTNVETGPCALSKREVEELVGSYRMDPLLASAKADKRILRNLKRLLYSPDELLRWRAAEALGRVSAVVFRTDPGAVSRLLQELFSSVTDTAASTWGAIDAIGEIIRFQPDAFSAFIPRLAQLSRDRSLLEDVLRALVVIGHEKPEALHMNSDRLVSLLEDDEPQIQGYTAILIGQLKLKEARANLERLLGSRSEMTIYMDGALRQKTVGQIAREALAGI